jgi:hypothetical protein
LAAAGETAVALIASTRTTAAMTKRRNMLQG